MGLRDCKYPNCTGDEECTHCTQENVEAAKRIKMSKRKYDFEFPLHLSGIQACGAPGMLQQIGVWDKIPQVLKDKLANSSFFSGVDVTKEDLDLIDDKTWKKIKSHLTS